MLINISFNAKSSVNTKFQFTVRKASKVLNNNRLTLSYKASLRDLSYKGLRVCALYSEIILSFPHANFLGVQEGLHLTEFKSKTTKVIIRIKIPSQYSEEKITDLDQVKPPEGISL